MVKIPDSLPWVKLDANVRDANGDFLFSNGRGGNIDSYIKEGDDAVAYAVHAANMYPALVKALEKIQNLTDGRPVDAQRRDFINTLAREALNQIKGGA